MVAIDGYIERCPLNHLDKPRSYLKPVFLLASNFTGVTTHAIFLKDHQ
jgi:hypothetical protein